MHPRELSVVSVLICTWMALPSCGDSNHSTSTQSTGGISSTGGTSGGAGGAKTPAGGSGGGGLATGGSGGGGGGGTGAGGTAAGGIGAGGNRTGGSGGSAAGGTVIGGSNAGGAAVGGAGTGGKGSGGASGSGAGGTTPPMDGGSSGGSTGTWVEDDGTDCTISGMPSSGSLTAIAKLPDPFTKLDGTRMTTKAEWHCRRQEIKRLGEQFAYGSKGAIPTTTGSVTKSAITVNVTLNGKSSTFSATIQPPTGGAAPYPAIIVYGGASFGAPLDSSVINSEGVALISYDPYQVGQEGTGRANKQGAYYSIYGSNSTTGLLVAWGWGVSRIIDVLAKSDGSVIKADAVAVTGCSRFGKGAFIAGAFDQRVALTMPIESGTAGVPIWRHVNQEGAQSLSSAYGEQPWFGDAFSAFTSAPTKAPLDTHEMIGMIAPRGLFIMDNPHITNLGPISADIAAQAGAEIYKALGVGDAITYYSDVQNGSHCSQRPEWSAPLKNNIERFLKKTGNAPGVIKAYAGATGDLSSWRDWTTPTLN